MKQYFTAKVHGMCGGVFAALKVLDEVVARHPDVYVFRELVHNKSVTADLTARGVHFVNDIDSIPPGSAIVLGAHGVAAETEKILRAKASFCRDATCPLVKKLHRIAAALTPQDQLIICGKAGHPEVTGIAGNSGTPEVFIVQNTADAARLPDMPHPVFISQTTVDHNEVNAVRDFLLQRYPGLREYSGVCDASRRRQEAVIELASRCDLVLVIGSAHSSNAKRLCEIARRQGANAFLIDHAGEIPAADLMQAEKVGVTSGASTPKHLFDGVIAALGEYGFTCGDAVSGTPNT